MSGGIIRTGFDALASRADSSIRAPAAIVALTGLVSGAPFVLYMQRLRANLGSEAFVYVLAGELFGIASLVAMNFLLWMFLAGAFYVIATFVFDADGEFRELLTLVGWGFVGLLGFRLVFLGRAVVRYVAGPGAVAPGTLSLVIGFVSGGLVLGSVVLWVGSVYETFVLTPMQAVTSVVLPVAFAFGIFLVPSLL